MNVIRVDDSGLRRLAALCASVSVELGELVPSPPVGPINQATSAAVAFANTAVIALSTALAARMAETGHKVATAAAAFSNHEVRSAEALAALGNTIEL